MACDTAHVRYAAAPADREELFDRILQGTVQVFATHTLVDAMQPFRPPQINAGVGTGFFIDVKSNDPSYFVVLTCAHVVQSCDPVHGVQIAIPAHSKARVPAHVLGISPTHDCAFLRVQLDDVQCRRVHVLPMANDNTLGVGDVVHACGYPLGQNLKLTQGTFSGYQNGLVQHTAAISPGNSGGPLVNADGAVVGYNASGVPTASLVGYAQPINNYRLIGAQMLRNGAPVDDASRLFLPPSLGLHMHPSGLEPGMVVYHVADKSPLAGTVAPGDVLTRVAFAKGDGTPHAMPIDAHGDVAAADNQLLPGSKQPAPLIELLARIPYDTELDLTFRRGDQTYAAAATRTLCTNVTGMERVVQTPYAAVDFCLVFGTCITEINLTHVESNPFLKMHYIMQHPSKRAAPQLWISHVFPESKAYANRTLQQGMLVAAINDTPVHTVAELRTALTACDGACTMHMVTGERFAMERDVWAEEERRMTGISTNTYRTDSAVRVNGIGASGEAPGEASGDALLLHEDAINAFLQRLGATTTDGSGYVFEAGGRRVGRFVPDSVPGMHRFHPDRS